MTKEDYMQLPKERLAELLVERDHLMIIRPETTPECYAPNGVCNNPFRDCVNCPKQWGGGWTSTTTTSIE